MFKIKIRNPETYRLEDFYVETATVAERMVLHKWPTCQINTLGEAIVFKQRNENTPLVDAKLVAGLFSQYPLVVATVQFSDEK